MNKDLYGNTIKLPDEVMDYLKQCHDAANGADDNTEGFRRNKELRDSGEITYQQLKRMKNWFDSFSGKENDLPFILNGGHYVRNWVDNTLTSMRDGVHNLKQNRSEVLPNQFIDPHEKDGINNLNRPSKSHSSNTEYYNLEVTESLKRINDLMKKII